VRAIRIFLLTALAAALVSCATVTIRPDDGDKLDTPPTWSKRLSFYFGGLVGEYHIDVRAVCGGQRMVQMQTQETFVDRLLRFVTLYVYSPRHVKIWCE
jgi:hypothetical protein